MHVDCFILDTGYCTAHEAMMLRGGSRRVIECHALVALIKHPTQGWGLWDTGYAPRMLTATEHLPYALYRRATPLFIRPELAVCNQLDRFGITPNEIKWIVLSHFHADHIAGLRDFPQATIFATAEGYADVRWRKGFTGLQRAFIPALMPSDFASRAVFIQKFRDQAVHGLGPTHDLFADGSLRLVELPGHARGQVGMLVQTAQRQILLAADGAWMRQAIREQRPPSRLTGVFVDDFAAVEQTIQRLHRFSLHDPEVVIMPTHCPEVYAQEVQRED